VLNHGTLLRHLALATSRGRTLCFVSPKDGQAVVHLHVRFEVAPIFIVRAQVECNVTSLASGVYVDKPVDKDTTMKFRTL
jgi:hypothetical protein